MFLAAKFEEIYPPDANEFAYVTADTYTRNEVLLMERMILKVFKCTLGYANYISISNYFHGGKYLFLSKQLYEISYIVNFNEHNCVY